ncbi:hypothetical protein [Methylomonas sp. UP202]|uniref:hypothetical protein n=1 Tax=Methylomonas sp. UP202 TaxID=3040943 RepID=UPI00247AB337|nr:hypothetical protein [Methylomonas sp. UP202]WGS88699.1 hypothetical protein QC632_24795 [Methylomonas sp. UP202]
MFSVSYYFQPDTRLSDYEMNSAHPHRILNGGGSGGANDYPDELWARAQQRHAEVLAFAEQCVNKPTVRFEWKRAGQLDMLFVKVRFAPLMVTPRKYPWL